MSTRHTYQTTYEQTRDDGTVTASVDVRITYDYSEGRPGYFNAAIGVGEPPTDDEIECVMVEESCPRGWQKAQPAVREWALSLCDEKRDEFAQSAINDRWGDAQ
ncbi:hypothetical protein ABNQ39_20725 [Azospirillum sp. A26]|uniref:hypothetical protein n=1 Tax=Azospirillum sp. A26 TaxID=3160607 RepID=UPI00366F1B16